MFSDIHIIYIYISISISDEKHHTWWLKFIWIIHNSSADDWTIDGRFSSPMIHHQRVKLRSFKVSREAVGARWSELGNDRITPQASLFWVETCMGGSHTMAHPPIMSHASVGSLGNATRPTIGVDFRVGEARCSSSDSDNTGTGWVHFWKHEHVLRARMQVEKGLESKRI